MGDSDDEREFRRRDKFHNERRGYDGGGSGLPRGEWREPRPLPPPTYAYRGRPAYGGGGGGRDRYSPEPPRGRRHHEMSPPAKRMRGGWEDERGFGGYDRGDFDREYDRPPPQRPVRHKQKDDDLEGFQPAMMSFKSFMQTQDDSISDEEGIKKYAEYKLEFKRQQLNEFFVTHKEEEWFKQKYHPDDSTQRKEELKAMLNKRVEVFQDFMSSEKFKDLSLDGDKQDVLIKVLDSVVIKLEGGSDFDLTVLDLPDPEEEKKEEGEGGSSSDRHKDSAKRKKDKEEEFDAENAALMKKAKEFLQFMEPEKKEKKEKSKERKESEEKSPRKRKRDEMSDEETEPEKPVKKEEEGEKDSPEKKDQENEEKEKEEKEVEKDVELSDVEEEKEVKKDAGDSTSKGSSQKKREEEEEESLSSEEEEDGRKAKEEKTKRPRALHKTSSIFLRNLAPTITKLEVEAMCRRYDGFLRAAIADPAPDRRWFRRGWVTFRRDVKIKDICFNLNNIRLKDCELGPIVNRDLTRRIRTVPGLTCDRKVVRNDIRLAAKIITNLDTKWGLWPSDKKDDLLGMASANPLLANITDYLIEEASAEEEELLGNKEGGEEEGEEVAEGETLTRDEELIKVLDRMILYLRIVHSVDFYNHSEYPNEDEMPNRCGILHVRGLPPPTKVTVSEMEEYMASFEKKMGGFLTPRHDLTDEEAMKLGLKNEEEEVEKFVMANTQELAKDKWLCPLSGKKFKGPDFVRKHIFNKHAEKVDEVKKEVRFYNSYLKDPKRPQLPEHPNSKPGARPAGSSGGGQPRPGDPYEYSGPNRDVTKYPVFADRGLERAYDRGGGYDRGYRQGALPPGRRDPYPPPGRSGRIAGGIDSFSGRPIITYRDWDAPNDDYF